MILPCKMMLFLRKGLSIPQFLLTSLPAPPGLKNPAVLLINRPTQTGESKDDDVVITGVGRFEPGNPVALTKHTVKEDFSALNKGKWDVELETYAALSAQDVHSGYLNRLYTSRDCEAGLVKMMRDKFEVTSLCFFFL